MRVTVIGAGLAGCEAAWQLLKRGVGVRLVEMKPVRYSPAHTMAGFAELVCSNSLKSESMTNASGLLKAEMRRFDSLILHCAKRARVPAGGALAVDRDAFSKYVTEALEGSAGCEIVREAAESVPESPAIIATGPLTDGPLAEAIASLERVSKLSFFDAAAPIVTAESIDMTRAFRASRYDSGEGDYINCPMTEAEYRAFYDALVCAELAEVHGFEKKLVFEGCLAVEILASRGYMTLAFGPLKPVGLIDPATGRPPFCAVQLRQDDAAGSLYNMVGFQTRLKWGEQKRVFSMIPALHDAEFARYGVMHRNTYLNGPEALDENFAYKGDPLLRFAGQITGVEGYMESAASGLVAGMALGERLNGRPEPRFSGRTMLGALMRHTITPASDYQPMNANYGLLDSLDARVRGKRERYQRLSERALAELAGAEERP